MFCISCWWFLCLLAAGFRCLYIRWSLLLWTLLLIQSSWLSHRFALSFVVGRQKCISVWSLWKYSIYPTSDITFIKLLFKILVKTLLMIICFYLFGNNCTGPVMSTCIHKSAGIYWQTKNNFNRDFVGCAIHERHNQWLSPASLLEHCQNSETCGRRMMSVNVL